MENIASWVAPIATTIAALMTASNLGSRITGYGFVVFTVGSLAWLTLGIVTGQPNLLWQSVILTGLNLFGIWRWLGRQAQIEDGAMAAAETSTELPSASLFPASLLTKAKLHDTNDAPIATCVDAMFDRRTGRPIYLVVAEGGVAGVGETLRRLPWSDVVVVDDHLRASLVASELRWFDSLERDQWPGR